MVKIMENPIKINDLGVPLFSETSIYIEGLGIDLLKNHEGPESFPIPSMHGIFTYIWLIFMVNVGKYTIRGWYGF